MTGEGAATYGLAGQLYLPVNLAFVPSNKGPRLSLLFGFNTGG